MNELKLLKMVCMAILLTLIGANLLSDLIITVQYLNFRISVMGKVNNPGSFNESCDYLTLFQAISMAGDNLWTS